MPRPASADIRCSTVEIAAPSCFSVDDKPRVADVHARAREWRPPSAGRRGGRRCRCRAPRDAASISTRAPVCSPTPVVLIVVLSVRCLSMVVNLTRIARRVNGVSDDFSMASARARPSGRGAGPPRALRLRASVRLLAQERRDLRRIERRRRGAPRRARAAPHHGRLVELVVVDRLDRARRRCRCRCARRPGRSTSSMLGGAALLRGAAAQAGRDHRHAQPVAPSRRRSRCRRSPSRPPR